MTHNTENTLDTKVKKAVIYDNAGKHDQFVCPKLTESDSPYFTSNFYNA